MRYICTHFQHLFFFLHEFEINNAYNVFMYACMHVQVIMKDLFRVLRDKLGADFDSFISKKVVAVAGDVSIENLGLDQDKNLKDEVLEELDIIVHTAATTTFDER